MGSRAIQQRLVELIQSATGLTDTVQRLTPTLDSDEATLAELGTTTDDEGRTVLNGWFVRPLADSDSERHTTQWARREYEWTVIGYRSRSSDETEESDAIDDADAVVEALMARTAFQSLTPRVGMMRIRRSTFAAPATLAGVAVWESEITGLVTEYPKL